VTWKTLGTVSPDRLSEARLQLHWAAQLLSAPGVSMLPAEEDYSHTNLGWDFELAVLNGRAELGAWFANAFRLIGDAVIDEASASAVRCWPHHFDVASLITLEASAAAEEARSIGVGFSPGDGSYDQPYFYVTPWPYPEIANLPPLAEGAEWHRSGWTGAVLSAERLLSVRPEEREHRARKALARAMAASRELLGN